MGESSVARPENGRPSTAAIVADEAFCGQAAAVLLCDEEPVRKALLGEPVKEALAMVEWALAHEDDEGFDPARALPNWAKRRKKGAWSTRPRRYERRRQGQDGEGPGKREVAVEIARYWQEHPEELLAALERTHAAVTTTNGGRS